MRKNFFNLGLIYNFVIDNGNIIRWKLKYCQTSK
jgi:metal-sulfur cluster biosynthetic enzyme